MKKIKLFTLLLALVLLFSLVACKKDEADEGEPTPPAVDDQTIDNGSSDNGDGEEGEDDSLPRAIRFSAGGRGFDTETDQLFDGSSTAAYDFTDTLVSALYYDMSECQVFDLPADLTYATLSGGGTPGADNILYTLSFTGGNKHYEIRIDSAAIHAYKDSNSDVSNMNAVVIMFTGLTDHYYNSLTQ